MKFDQPSGDCKNCKWSKSTDDTFWCTIKLHDIINPVCISKNMIVRLNHLINHAEIQTKDMERGEEWKPEHYPESDDEQ